MAVSMTSHADLCPLSSNRFERKESERFRCFSFDELQKRDKLSLDITWPRDESLEDTDNLPDPAVLAAEIVEDLQAALDQFAQITADLAKPNLQPPAENESRAEK